MNSIKVFKSILNRSDPDETEQVDMEEVFEAVIGGASWMHNKKTIDQSDRENQNKIRIYNKTSGFVKWFWQILPFIKRFFK